MHRRGTAAEYRRSLSVVTRFLCLWLVTAFIPSLATAENAAELGDSIRRLTRPVADSVRSVIQSNIVVGQENSVPVKEKDKAETSKGGVSSTSDAAQLSHLGQ